LASIGGVVALALALSPKEKDLDAMIEFFTDAAEKTFSETLVGLISKVDRYNLSSYAAMLFRFHRAIYDSAPLEKALISFFGHSSLFAPSLSGRPTYRTRVFVTAAKEGGTTNCIIPNYSCPSGPGNASVELEDDEAKGMKVWEAALATAAAPRILPPFIKAETNTDFVDGAVYANCPAQIAYTEMTNLWPDNGASLDILLSLGTGHQPAKKPKLLSLLNIGFLAVVNNMVQKQLDSTLTWDNFAGSCDQSHRSKLRRVNPPINGDRVELYDYKKMKAMMDDTKEWCGKPKQAVAIQEIADTLVASLFFFEPDPSQPLLLRNRNERVTLQGSIRCRLLHDSPELETLLGRVNSFWHGTIVAGTKAAATAIENVGNWQSIKNPTDGDQRQGMKVLEDGVWKFRVPHTISARRDADVFPVVAVELGGAKIPVSGFPSSIEAMCTRAGSRWLT
jgi:hypothetical protein